MPTPQRRRNSRRYSSHADAAGLSTAAFGRRLRQTDRPPRWASRVRRGPGQPRRLPAQCNCSRRRSASIDRLNPACWVSFGERRWVSFDERQSRVEQYLSKIKVIRTIASKIITFLAQLENFQKKLWLKKKFVIETHWCVALSAIPEDFYPDIARNDSQRDEWIQLLAIEEIQGDLTVAGYSNALTPEFLKSHPTLAIDTRHFEPNFVERLLESLGDIDQNTDGLLVHSENFQALTLMEARYRGEIKCIYIDPPYNTDAGPIDYKNGYRSSSWMSMIQDRLSVSRRFLSDDGVLCATIDDYQVHELAGLLDQEFGRENQLGTAVIRINPSGRPSVRGLSVAHEYAFFYTNGDSSLERLPRISEK